MRAQSVDDWLPLLGPVNGRKQIRQVTGAWHDLKNFQHLLRSAFTSSSESNVRNRELNTAVTCQWIMALSPRPRCLPSSFFFFDNCLQLLHALMGNCIHLSSPGGGSPKPELFTPCALPVGRTTYSKLRPLPINSQPSCGLKARAVKYITVMHLYPQTFFFLYADFTVWSPVNGLYHTCNEGPDEVRVQIHRQYSSILYLLRRKSIAVPGEDQCKLVTVLGTCPTPTSDTFLSVPYL